MPAQERDEFQGRMDLMSHGQRVDGEAVRQRKDGSRLHVLVVSVPLSVPGGQIKACVMYRDITERKAAEIALLYTAS